MEQKRKHDPFSPFATGKLSFKNRMIRSATYEGLAATDGTPQQTLSDLYIRLARGGVGGIISGFVFIEQAGRAMQPCQAGIDTEDKAVAWAGIISAFKQAAPAIPFIMQLAHTGRQTTQRATGTAVHGVSKKPCPFFNQRVKVLDDRQIGEIITCFGEAAFRSRQAGCDGIQIHAAHGYLIHQFMSDVTNTRNDRWRDPALFLSEVVCAVKTRCGSSYPVLLKVSGAEDHPQGLTPGKVAAILNRLPKDSIQAVEVSYGTMGYALNIMRGQWPVKAALKVNPLFNERSAIALFIWKRFCMQRYLKHLLPFSAHYNAAVAAEIKARTALPVIVTGGIRKMKDIDYCLNESKLNAVSLCRPLISDPEFVVRLQADRTHDSNCTNCNLCAIHCDSLNPTVCYRNKTS